MRNRGTAKATGSHIAHELLKSHLALAVALSCAFMFAGSTAIWAKPLWLLERPDTVAQAPQVIAAPLNAESAVSQPIFDDTAYALCHVATVQVGPGGGSDCWGWVDGDGNQYAIMGINTGIAFIDVATEQVVDIVPGPTFNCGNIYWRDMKTMGQYCYAVSECDGSNAGISVIDMQYLPDSAHLIISKTTSSFGTVTSHNLSIDSIAGFLYVEGQGSLDRNIYIHDLSDPTNPIYVAGMGDVSGHSIHDMYVYADTVYVAEGSSSSFSIWDLSDKNNPQLLTRWTTPSGGYAHNIWPNEDHTLVATTEETAQRTVKLWNIEDYENIQLVGEYLAPAELAHNAQIRGDRLYLSHYESGIRVVDISDPSAPVEIGAYDTYPTSEVSSFNGAWGVYNYSPYGYVFGSNDNGKLFILEESEFVVMDSFTVDSVEASPGDKIRVDISAHNALPVRQFIVPVTWDGPAAVTLDSVSKVGTRAEYFQSLNLVNFNPFASQAAYSLVSSSDGSAPDLEPGSGPILSLYFSVAGGSTEAFNPVQLTEVGGASPAVTSGCGVSLAPQTLDGGIDVCSVCGSCCVTPGDGNHDGTFNISDVTFGIAHIFSGGAAPTCQDEGDANGDNSFNISDVTYGIAHIFSSGPAPVCGATGQ